MTRLPQFENVDYSLNRAVAKERLVEIISGLTDRQRVYMDSVPDGMKRVIGGALVGDSSPIKAIKAKCLDCSNFDRDEVKNCTVVTCALFNLRPYQDKSDLDV